MRRCVPLLAFVLGTSAAWACGDKLMLVMRVRIAQLKLGHPLAILAYARPGLPTSATIRQFELLPAVKKAGHRFQFLEDPAQLDATLKSNKYDLVLADSTVADQFSEHAKASPFHPVVLPVTYKATKQEDSATQKKFHCLLKTPGDSDQYFEAIDQALQWKAKAATH